MADSGESLGVVERIPSLPREAWTDAARAVFAFWGEPDATENGSQSQLVMVLAQHPALAQAYFTFGKHLLIDSTVPPRPRELVVLRTAWLLKAAYEWHYHVGYALQIGLTLDEIAAIRTGAEAPGWDEADRAVLRAVDELTGQSRLSDATWALLSRHFDTPQIMDLVFTIGNYATISWAIAALGIPLEPHVDPIGFDLKTRSGVAPAIHYKPGGSVG